MGYGGENRFCVLARQRHPHIANTSFSAQSTLAKVGMEPIEPIDEVDCGKGACPCARWSGCGLSLAGV